MELNVMNDLIKSSRCYGRAYDGDVKECKICEAWRMCKKKMENEFVDAPSHPVPASKDDISISDQAVEESKLEPAKPRPVPEVAAEDLKDPESLDHVEDKPKKTAKKPAKAKTPEPSDLPVFKDMSLEELFDLAKDRGIKLEDFEKYSKDAIKRMRVTMALKKTYL